MLLSSASVYIAVRGVPVSPSSSKHRLQQLLQPHGQLRLGPGIEWMAEMGTWVPTSQLCSCLA